MRTILINLDDKDFEEAEKKKGNKSWKTFFLESIGVLHG
jgi:hypothetical protein